MKRLKWRKGSHVSVVWVPLWEDSFRFGMWQPSLKSCHHNSWCTPGQAHGSLSHQKRAFRFCLTKLPRHADVINNSVMLYFKPSINEDEGNIWTQKWIFGYLTIPGDSLTAFHRDLWITDRYFPLCAMRGTDWASLWRDAGVYSGEESNKGCLTPLEKCIFFFLHHANVFVKFCDSIFSESPCACETGMNYLDVACLRLLQ